MNETRRVGMLTPSSNTVLEPLTAAMFAPFGEAASVHFSRFRVTEISMSAASQAQFDETPIIEAAQRLAEAKVHSIAWNGTSAAWLGLDRDVALAARIEAETGIAATTTMLSYERVFAALGVTRLGLVTPYLGEIQERIVGQYAGRGIEVIAERRLEDPGNFSFSTHTPETVAAMVREVAASKPDAIAIVCTNFRGAPVAAALEAETGIPVIDSVAITAAATQRAVGLAPSAVTGWGSIFATMARLDP